MGQQFHHNLVHYLRKAISYTDDGNSVTVGTLPAGAHVLRGGIAVTTAFNGGTTNTANVGTAGDVDGYASAIALGTVGNIVFDDMATSDDAAISAETDVLCAVTSTASASAGAGYVWVEYIVNNGETA